jgi:uncharacterized lipoprotein YmbA
MNGVSIVCNTSLLRRLISALTLTLGACAAAPPLQLYTLADPPEATQAALIADKLAPPQDAPVIEVERVRLPDEVDSTDLIVRQGDTLRRSTNGRWASSLAVGATDLITARLRTSSHDVWIINNQRGRAPDYHLMVQVNRFDVMSNGVGVLAADWQIVPSNSSAEVIRGETRFAMNGSVATDSEIVRFDQRLLSHLADQINGVVRQTYRPGTAARARVPVRNGG